MSWHSSLRLTFANKTATHLTGSSANHLNDYDKKLTMTGQNRTSMTQNRHQGVLMVQRALYPEPASIPSQAGICHAIILYPPAGIASKDKLAIHIDCQTGSHSVLTTPGAGKWYGIDDKSGEQASFIAPAQQTVTANLAEHARLEWLPQENIVFNHANVHAQTHIEVAPTASLLTWDITVFGRQAYHEAFLAGRFHNEWLLTRNGKPMVFEAVNQPATSRWFTSPLGMNGKHVVGTFWAIPSLTYTEQTLSLPATVEALRHLGDDNGLPVQMTHTRHGVCIRYLGSDVRACFDAFVMLKDEIRKLWWGLKAHSPRIWET